MNAREALAACEATVRRADPDHYFASLFARAEKRPLLFALYAFRHEIAHAVAVTQEPLMAEIRLQWWREAVDLAREGRPPAQPAAIGLAELFARASPPPALFAQLIDATASEIAVEQWSDIAAIESHVEAAAAVPMRIAGALLDPEIETNVLMHAAGIAYGLARLLQELPSLAARGSFPRHDAATTRGTIARIADAARDHLERARGMRLPERVLPAVLPAALVDSYLTSAMHVRDPLRERIDISALRRQLVLLRAALIGRL
jgi:phytoene synthase